MSTYAKYPVSGGGGGSVISVNGQVGVVVLTATDVGAIPNTVLTTKGDLLGYNGSTDVRVPVGTNGQVLTADSTSSTGVSYQTPASGGTVTSVAATTNSVSGLTLTGSPITTSGTLAFTLGQSSTSTNGYLSSGDFTTFNNKQAAGNYITALTGDVTASGPGSVAATLATVNANVGTFTYSTITVNGKGLITAASSGAAPTGTVTSVALSLPAAVFTVTGSPVTTSGTLTGTFATQTANTVFAGPSSGSAAAPTFRALASADLPNPFTVSSKSANFTAAANFLYLVNVSGGAVSVQLPAPSSGLLFIVKDSTGNANTNNLTLVRNSTEKIEGIAASKILQSNWGTWTIVSNGTDWFMV